MIIRILKMRRVQMQDKIVINDYIGNYPLSEENLDKKIANRFRLSFPTKSIWLYSGYDYQKIMRQLPNLATQDNYNMYKRQKIIKQCDVMVDGRYIDSQRDITLKWRGSDNQRVINVQESLKQRKIVLYCD